MPTTCGFPNCKFRSRYRGHHDNRHFYRVPKKPAALRERWLQAIGRTESTIVNQQLRICSGHFHGGRKSEGDIPVADPDVDSPIRIDISALTAGKRLEKLPKCRRVVSTTEKLTISSLATLSRSNGQTFECGEFTPPASSSDVESNRSVAEMSPGTVVPSSRSLVVLLDGRDCSVEMPLLKDLTQVAFCDAESMSDVHEKVLNEAVGALLYGNISLSREDLMKFKTLKVIVHLGTGSGTIDVKAASELGIAVSSIPRLCVEEVADSTLCLILNLYRRTYWLACDLSDGKKISSAEELREIATGATRLRGQTLGIIGLGQVGRAVALRAKVFGFNVIFYDPNTADGIDKSLGITRVFTLQEIFIHSDCISLHCSFSETNRNLINSLAIGQMRRGVYIVNTAHGSLIDEEALAAGLKDGRVKAAALDVQAIEPFSLSDSPLRDCPNLLCTPHTAFFSDQSLTELRQMAAHELRRALVGHVPFSLHHCANRELLNPAIPDIVNNLRCPRYHLPVRLVLPAALGNNVETAENHLTAVCSEAVALTTAKVADVNV